MICHGKAEEEALVEALRLYPDFCTGSDEQVATGKKAGASPGNTAYGESNRLPDAHANRGACCETH